ncbi:FMN-dependent NADH-azoreductase [Salimicrobium halophilum]|uniref:FMN dependent NADH:quinone oxidoreductase n=1 Tax=Salimicrobium halophilum TaxID=86666 RepID=A0A1G8TA83_9BACI|nr:FMN-dependent NADH-azoreductase [Salimicrobium halophilum]SDJ37580.1 FMN-dependent NADH-azoreductase [Salimicrobium halophilum]
MNVLVVKANNRPDGISTRMYDTFLEQIEENQDLNITTYDLFEEDMPYFGQDLFSAIGKQQEGVELNDTEARLLQAKQKAKDLVAQADTIVLAFPLWNFTVPAKMQTFIDYLAEAGFSFRYTPEGQHQPLLTDKRVIMLNARGGNYSAPEMQPVEMAVNYVRNIFGMHFGMDIKKEVVIEGHNADPNAAETIINEGLEEVKKTAQTLAYQNA